MESEELSTDRTKVRRSRDELQGTRDEHEGEDTSPVKGVASATGSPRVDFGRQGLREALKGYGRQRGEVAVNQPGKADCTLPGWERKEYHINEPSGRRWRDGMAHNRWPTPGVR